jgi:dTDP-4-dehydrorhamnose reductase
MKAIVVGADGGIGRALINTLRQRGDIVWGTSRRSDATTNDLLPLDLADRAASAISLPVADVAFFCAAITSFAECRRDPVLARAVNVANPSALARRLAAAGMHVVLLSTSAVFDWRVPLVPASRPTCAVSVYGKLKAEAEAEFLDIGRAASVVRFAKVLTPDLKLFTGWIEALDHEQPVRAFTDLRMAPIALSDAVTALLAVAEDARGGIYQLSSATDISYLDAARHLAGGLGRSPDLVAEGHASEVGIPQEEITNFSSLDSSRLAKLTGRAAPDPFAAIDAVFGPAIVACCAKRDNSHDRFLSRR